MPNYQDGKIYKIVNTINGTIYYGSTTQCLSRRMQGHRDDSKRRSSNFYVAMQTLGSANFHIILVRVSPCNSKDELDAEEFKETQLATARGEMLYNTNRAFVSEVTDKQEKIEYDENHRSLNADKYQCEACEYKTYMESNLTRHLGTRKHKLEWDEYVFDVEMDRLADIEL